MPHHGQRRGRATILPQRGPARLTHMTSTTIVTTVNQAEAIRRGFNADSTSKFELDVTGLSPEQRTALADNLVDGRFRRKVSQPGPEGLIEALDRIIVLEAEQTARAEEQREKTRAAFANDPAALVEIEFNGRTRLKYPHELDALDAAQRTAAETIADRLREERAKEKAAEAARLAENKARRLESAAARTKLLDDYAAARGGTLAKRRAAGYASDGEIADLFAEDERQRRGLAWHGGCPADWDRAAYVEDGDSLTDEQFERLEEFRAKLPEHTVVTIYRYYGAAVDPDDCPADGDTEVPDRIVAKVNFVVNQIRVEADCELT